MCVCVKGCGHLESLDTFADALHLSGNGCQLLPVSRDLPQLWRGEANPITRIAIMYNHLTKHATNTHHQEAGSLGGGGAESLSTALIVSHHVTPSVSVWTMFALS